MGTILHFTQYEKYPAHSSAALTGRSSDFKTSAVRATYSFAVVSGGCWPRAVR